MGKLVLLSGTNNPSQEIGNGIRFVKFAGEYINLAYVRRIYIHKQSNGQWEIVMVLEQHDYDSHVISEVTQAKKRQKELWRRF